MFIASAPGNDVHVSLENNFFRNGGEGVGRRGFKEL